MSSRVVQSLAILIAVNAPLLAQTTVTVQAVADNTLYQDATGSISNGSGSSLFIGITGQPSIRRALVRFDLAPAVPAGARVLQAELVVTVSQSSYASPLDCTGHRVLASWGEGASAASGGGGGGAPAAVGDATWLHRFHPNTSWTTPGGDYATQPSFRMSTPQTGAASSSGSAGMLADVQSWLDQPGSNHGWLLRTDETLGVSRRLESRESANVAGRPRLVVTYLLPMQSTNWGTGCTVAGAPHALAVVGMPMTGNSLGLRQSNGPAGNASACFFALALEPNGLPLLPGCSLYLPLAGNVATGPFLVLDAAGSATLAVPLPPAAAGLFVAAQAAAIASTPEGFSLSNAVAFLVM